jgi:hypothetical protein
MRDEAKCLPVKFVTANRAAKQRDEPWKVSRRVVTDVYNNFLDAVATPILKILKNIATELLGLTRV